MCVAICICVIANVMERERGSEREGLYIYKVYCDTVVSANFFIY